MTASDTTRAPRLALATYAALPDLNAEDQQLRALLTLLGVSTQVCVWNDPAIAWEDFDAVLIRSIWDYFQHYQAYLDWLDRLRHLGVRTLNPDAVLRWNSDKRYLRDMAEAGVAIAPTRWLRGAELVSRLHDGGGDWVVKPAVSGGAWHTVRGVAGNTDFAAALAALPAEMEFLVQPYLPEIVSAGEWSLLFFGDQFSHAVLKTPAAGDYRVQSQFGGRTQAVDPPAAVLVAARQALAVTTARLGEQLAYARVDGVVVDGSFVLMELELIEPYLFMDGQPQAVQRLADVVEQALRRR